MIAVLEDGALARVEIEWSDLELISSFLLWTKAATTKSLQRFIHRSVRIEGVVEVVQQGLQARIRRVMKGNRDGGSWNAAGRKSKIPDGR